MKASMHFRRPALPALLLLVCIVARPAAAQRSDKADDSSGTSSAVAVTNSMEVLDNQRKLQTGDRISYRVVEERRPPISLVVTDSGELELPLIGRVSAAGKTCKELAYNIRTPLERDYFYKATVIVGLDTAAVKARGTIYVTGQVHSQGSIEIPPNEIFTLSKALMKAGGLADFANKHKIKLLRKEGNETKTTFVDLTEIIDKGHSEKDPVLQPDDTIVVPERLVNF